MFLSGGDELTLVLEMIRSIVWGAPGAVEITASRHEMHMRDGNKCTSVS